MTKFRNQEALNKALNIYKVSMCQFIFEHLQKRVRGETVENLIRRIVNREPSDLEPKHISQVFLRRECWDFFKQQFGYDSRLDSDKYDIKSAAAMIVMGRNKVHHVGSTIVWTVFWISL